MKKLLLIIPLLVGCTRDYRCEPQWYNTETGEISSTCPQTKESSYIQSNCYSITLDWPKGKKEAEEICEEGYNNSEEMHTLPVNVKKQIRIARRKLSRFP